MENYLKPVSLAIDSRLLRDYAELTDDYNPIHLDAEFAQASPMKGIIAHGTLSLGLIWCALAQKGGSWNLLEIRFINPVRLGDVVTAGGIETSPGKVDVWVVNQKGEAVIRGKASSG